MAVALANLLQFSETEQGNLAIALTEAAKNIVKHADRGEILLRAWEGESQNWIELIALDQGLGMANVTQCLQDGFSTAGTPGIGLGAIQRLSSRFDIYSYPQLGTVLRIDITSPKDSEVTGSEKQQNLSKNLSKNPSQNQLQNPLREMRQGGWGDRDTIPPALNLFSLEDYALTFEAGNLAKDFAMGFIQVPKPGEQVSGDACAIEYQSADRCLVLVSDGLGSGTLAAEASRAAIQVLQQKAQLGLKAILEAAHLALRSTRGAAIAIAEILPQQQQLRFAGVGNISGTLLTGDKRQSLVSYNGTVGYQFRKVEEFTYPWTDHSLLVMHSDGLGTQWNLSHYPGLIQQHPTVITSVLYRDFRRSRDDVTVLAIRNAYFPTQGTADRTATGEPEC
jgi:anti-sigma regulatory factor (Ser/Thr protein kinase)